MFENTLIMSYIQCKLNKLKINKIKATFILKIVKMAADGEAVALDNAIMG